MKERIKQIIELENISYSKFADIIEIQRSGISHIINGRNKPSLEVIQKILEAYDYINTDWLLFGKGTMKKDEFVETQGNLFEEKVTETIDNKSIADEEAEIKVISEEYIEDRIEKKEIKPSQEDKLEIKKIERIVIFYSDKSFSEYSPEKI